jgi:hypothetical protein
LKRKNNYETKIIENNPDEIIKQLAWLTTDSNELATCLAPGGMQYSYNYFFDIKRNLLDKQKRGEHRGIRYVTIIVKDNLKLVRTYLESGIRGKTCKKFATHEFWNFRQGNRCNY